MYDQSMNKDRIRNLSLGTRLYQFFLKGQNKRKKKRDLNYFFLKQIEGPPTTYSLPLSLSLYLERLVHYIKSLEKDTYTFSNYYSIVNISSSKTTYYTNVHLNEKFSMYPFCSEKDKIDLNNFFKTQKYS